MQTIAFNKNIYKLTAINEAIAEFKNLADFKIKEKGAYFEVQIDKIDSQVKNIIKDEFANYALGRLS